MKLGFAAELDEAEQTGGWGAKGAPRVGNTILDRVRQSMILFAAGRGEDSLEDILRGYPWMEREDVLAGLAYARRLVAHERVEALTIDASR